MAWEADAKWGNERIRRGALVREIMREGDTLTMKEAHEKAREIMAEEDAAARRRADVAGWVAEMRDVGMWDGE